MSESWIAERYRLEGRLGIGGMSTVHLATDTRLERRVAVKLLAEHLAEEEAFVSRFRREAQAAARLVHRNIVQVFDSGYDEASNQYFIVMEYVEGQSCAEILRDENWVEVDEALRIVEQACEGLAYAHRHGVVHRDVKPGNLLRSSEGEVKLADFGIAKATEESSITQVGSVIGTAAYLAPEQARGDEAGPAADIYALGVVTYQMISGRLPYEAGSLTELALKQQREQPPRLDELVAAVTPELSDAVDIALALKPEERFENALDFGAALRDGRRGVAPAEPAAAVAAATAATSVIAGGRSAQSARGGRLTPRPGPAPAAATGAPPARQSRRRERRRGGRVVIALVALMAAALAVIAIVLLTAPSETKVQLRNVVYKDVSRASEELASLVTENTK
jgi:serine/threonine-protein kinase